MADDEFCFRRHWLIGKPADHSLDVLRDLRWVVGFHQGIAAGDVDLIGESEADGLRGEGFLFLAIGGMDGFHTGFETRGKDGDFVAGLEDAAGNTARVAAEVVPFVGHGTDDPLDGEAGIDVIFLTADVDVFQVVEESRSFIPWHVGGFIDDVVAIEGGDGDRGDIDDVVEAGGELAEVGNDLIEDLLGVIDEIHFVDGDDEVLDAEKVGDEGVALGLLDHAFACVDENDGEVGGGGAGNHVAGVLDVTRRVRDDEFPFRCGEVAVGDIDRDSLFALGLEAIGEEGEVHILITAAARGFLHGFELVFEDGFGIVKKAADESGFAVIDGASGGEAE